MKNLFSCSRDIFSKKEAESWWTENGNRVRAIYNVPPFQHTVTNDRISSSEDEVQIHHALKILHNNQYLYFTRMVIHEDELFPEIFLDVLQNRLMGVLYVWTDLRSISLCNSCLQPKGFTSLIPRRFNEKFQKRLQQCGGVGIERWHWHNKSSCCYGWQAWWIRSPWEWWMQWEYMWWKGWELMGGGRRSRCLPHTGELARRSEGFEESEIQVTHLF